jgi:hypothetical protein
VALSPSLAKGGVGVGRFAVKQFFGVATIFIFQVNKSTQ